MATLGETVETEEGREETEEGREKTEEDQGGPKILFRLSQAERRPSDSDSESESENFHVILDHTAEADYEDTFGERGDTLPATLPAPTLPPATMPGSRRSTRRRVARSRSWSPTLPATLSRRSTRRRVARSQSWSPIAIDRRGGLRG